MKYGVRIYGSGRPIWVGHAYCNCLDDKTQINDFITDDINVAFCHANHMNYEAKYRNVYKVEERF